MRNYNFKTKHLDYDEIGWRILDFYNLGCVENSDFDVLEKDKPKYHYIIGTGGMIEFVSKVFDDNPEYIVSIFARRIVRR